MDLELARADRRLDPVPVAARGRERLRDGGLRRPEEAQRPCGPAPARGRAPAAPAARPARAARAAAAHAAGLAGRRRRHDPSPARARAPSPRGRASARPPGSSPACVTPGVELGVRASEALGDHLRHRRRSHARAPPSTTSSTPAARATRSTVRSSWVGPRPPETRQRSASKPFRERAVEILRPVADDRDPLGLEARAGAPRRRGTARFGPGARRERARCP